MLGGLEPGGSWSGNSGSGFGISQAGLPCSHRTSNCPRLKFLFTALYNLLLRLPIIRCWFFHHHKWDALVHLVLMQGGLN